MASSRIYLSTTFCASICFCLSTFCVSVAPSQPRTCPDGWKNGTDRCYLIKTDPSKYNEAKNHCSNAGGVLASVNNSLIYEFLRNLINEIWLTNGNCKNSTCKIKFEGYCRYESCFNFWIGLQHNVSDCYQCNTTILRQGWTWMDGSIYDQKNTSWGDKEPQGYEHPVRLGINNALLEVALYDTEGDPKIGYICSKPIGQESSSSSTNAPTGTRAMSYTPSKSVSATAGLSTTVSSRDINLGSTGISETSATTTISSSSNEALIFYSDSIDTTSFSSDVVSLHMTAENKKSQKALIIGLAAGIGGGVLLITCIAILVICLVRKRRRRDNTKKINSREESSVSERDNQHYNLNYDLMNPYNGTASHKSIYPPDNDYFMQPYSTHHAKNGPGCVDEIQPYGVTGSTTDRQLVDEIQPYGVTGLGTGRSPKNDIEPYSMTGSRGGRFPSDEIHPYGVTGPGKISGVNETASQLEDEYANGDQVKPKKSKIEGIYDMFHKRFSNFPVYAVPDKSNKTSRDKKKPEVKAKPAKK